MKIYGFFDLDLNEFVKLQFADNDVMFRRWLQKFLQGLILEVKQNPLHPLADLITDSSKFDVYDLGELNHKDGVITQPDTRRIFCNLNAYVDKGDLDNA
jgi:hypothetical protein